MELSEAKEIIKDFLTWDNKKYPPKTECEAIETILKALDNSISKDEIEKKIAEINSIEWQPGVRTAGKSVKYWKMVGAENALKELLGDD